MRRIAAIVVALGLLAAAAADARVWVGADTEVRSIRFSGVENLSERRLHAVLHTRSRGRAHWLRAALGRLPIVPDPAPHPFHPRVLQEDVARLREAYAAAGFLEARITYDVRRDDEGDLLDITFLVEEGAPLLVREVTVAAADSASLPVPPGEEKGWRRMEREAAGLAGRPLDLADVVEERSRIERWWRNRGFWKATVDRAVQRDSLASEASVRFVVDTGPAASFGPIEVEGNESISDGTAVRQLSFRPGDPFSEESLGQGSRDLRRLEIVRTARVQLADSAAATAGAVPVRITLTERDPRLISGEIGYITDAGLTGELQWSHFSFAGGARVLSVSALGQTGALALVEDPDERYRGTVSLTQPNFLLRRLSGVVSPFVEYREDIQDRSLEAGSNFTLVYQVDRLSSASIDYRISQRRIFEYRGGDVLAGSVDLLTFLSDLSKGVADSLGKHLTNSLVTLSATAGNLDDPAEPRRGFLVRPALQITLPSAVSDENYWRPDLEAHGFLPLTRRSTLAARASAGRLFPFGKSLPAAGESGTSAFLRLRDATFTAGGSGDVRGWPSGLLGPKFPELRIVDLGDSIDVVADGYSPIGGFSRAAFSVELRMPFPPLGQRFGSHVFLDGGRVWTSDDRYAEGPDTLDQERFFYAAGAGLDIRTPVGAVRLSLAYKLNPSVTDLVDSGDVYHAILDGTPLDTLERHEIRRWQVHLAIGASY